MKMRAYKLARRLSSKRLSWKRRLTTILAFLVIAALGGFLYAWAGLAPISARSGHWSVTAWFLHFAMRQGVETRAAVGVEKPADVDLADPVLALRGAPHFASGCAPCHGAPGEARSAIARAMTPRPPRLEERVPDWSDEELFWILQNGIKFSAMPAWPADHREDEVWAMVAFLRRLPGMTPEEWRAMAGLDAGRAAPEMEVSTGAAAGGGTRIRGLLDRVGEGAREQLVESCARCHGLDGLGRGEGGGGGEGAFPKLAGQKETYLYASLRAYAEDERQSGFMRPVAVALSDAEMRDLAAYYSALAPGDGAVEAVGSEEARALGAEIAARGVPARGIPACDSCHGPGTSAYYPFIAGQYEEYLSLQLEAWRAGDRGGTPFAHVMHMAAEDLTDPEIAALAAYYASLPAHGGRADEARARTSP
ncbi:c-type cytochrome [Salinarimonas ramus]|uniref:Cytochrome c n=1 Tax=Salinarimonas ramus TaxID=690164 RepID=A0A917V2E1_9HYPH|nr:c-type cytochrome [Salinarimonas ramus]GGK21132.1 cytochrome c [Salinarimonas ramus]